MNGLFQFIRLFISDGESAFVSFFTGWKDHEETIRAIVSLIGTVAVVDLIAIVLQGAKVFNKAKGVKKWVRIISIGVAGGFFGIFATITSAVTGTESATTLGENVFISACDVGPIMAGILGGPVCGLIAGVIAGVQRLLFGLPDLMVGSTIPCAFSAVVIGTICGISAKQFEIQKKHRTLWAAFIGFSMEVFHLLFIFIFYLIVHDFNTAIYIVSKMALPLILTNAIAFALLIFVHDRLNTYMESAEHEKSIESELGVATKIQTDMLPSIFPDFPGRPEFMIDASMTPAKEVGGDFYDFFFVDEDHFAFLIADVSGKGVPAALFMVISKTIIKNNLQSGLTPSQAFEKANQQLCEGNAAQMFVTAWLGVLEISTGTLHFVNAGHNPPILHSGDKYTFLRNFSGFILAGRPKSKYKEFQIHLADDDRIFLYTDGVTEAMDKNNNQYDESRLLACLKGSNHSIGSKDIIQYVFDDVKKFANGAEQSDDITMLALKITGHYETITVPATLDKFNDLSAFLEEKLEQAGVPMSIIPKMDIVLDELFSNVVKYSGSDDFTLKVGIKNQEITILMQYGGLLFDVTEAKEQDITLAAKDRPIGGLGLMLVKKSVDYFNYHNDFNKNIIVLRKKF